MVTATCTARRMILSIANIQWGLIRWFLKILFTCKSQKSRFLARGPRKKEEFLLLLANFYSEIKCQPHCSVFLPDFLSLPDRGLQASCP